MLLIYRPAVVDISILKSIRYSFNTGTVNKVDTAAIKLRIRPDP